jgi:hypothetical protein
MAPMIPKADSWFTAVTEIVHLSFLGLVADIWTQLLASKRDAKEKRLYLFWDDAVPQSTPLTSLAWLLTCETWPMPNHLEPDLSKTRDAFPPQSFVLPQSTPYGFAGTRPVGFARGMTGDLILSRSLNSLLSESMHRGDRDAMALVGERTPIFRPSFATSYGHHVNRDERYAMMLKWPRLSTRDYDHGLAAHELQESWYHHRAIMDLRASIMNHVLVQPGLPTHQDNLHNPAGMWIRDWSELGLMLRQPKELLSWTPESTMIKLETGINLLRIPACAPRTWFGFTHIGPNYEGDGDSVPMKRVETASERWAHAYLKHRAFALKMLFQPESINTADLVEEATSARAKLLERAGRLKKAAAKSGGGFAAAFANVTKKQENQE